MWIDAKVMDSGIEQFRRAARLAIARAAELLSARSPTPVLNRPGSHDVDGLALLDG